MKLQHLTVIFVIIMLPISLIISAYTQMQIDTLVLQQQYDAKVMDATYDAIKAFDINTTGNTLSNMSDSVRKDISAAISTFMTSLANSMGVPGYEDEYIKPYVPAILFTMYDGYYIYAPSIIINDLGNKEYKYTLQPYNYYSVRYFVDSNNDIVVNYTLDNYIVVYGYVNGKYVVRSGYLETETNCNKARDIENGTNAIYENVPIVRQGTENTGFNNSGGANGVQIRKVEVTSNDYTGISGEYYLYSSNDMYYIDPNSADNYYKEAKEFTKWVNEKLGNIITPSCARRAGQPISKFATETTKKIFKINNSNDPTDEQSDFNQHRIEIIQDAIEDNLNYVITAYAGSIGDSTYNFRMPKLNPEEWVTISSNICMVSFVQGMPVGSRFYNNYAVVSSSTNKFFADPDNIYFIGSDGYYHRIDCPKLTGSNIKGFSSYSFQPFKIRISETDQEINYWRHNEKACYYCIVGNRYEKTTSINERAYNTAVAREKYRQYKTTDYFGEANKTP